MTDSCQHKCQGSVTGDLCDLFVDKVETRIVDTPTAGSILLSWCVYVDMYVLWCGGDSVCVCPGRRWNWKERAPAACACTLGQSHPPLAPSLCSTIHTHSRTRTQHQSSLSHPHSLFYTPRLRTHAHSANPDVGSTARISLRPSHSVAPSPRRSQPRPGRLPVRAHGIGHTHTSTLVATSNYSPPRQRSFFCLAPSLPPSPLLQQQTVALSSWPTTSTGSSSHPLHRSGRAGFRTLPPKADQGPSSAPRRRSTHCGYDNTIISIPNILTLVGRSAVHDSGGVETELQAAGRSLVAVPHTLPHHTHPSSSSLRSTSRPAPCPQWCTCAASTHSSRHTLQQQVTPFRSLGTLLPATTSPAVIRSPRHAEARPQTSNDEPTTKPPRHAGRAEFRHGRRPEHTADHAKQPTLLPSRRLCSQPYPARDMAGEPGRGWPRRYRL